MRITKVTDEGGFWVASVTVDGTTYQVDRKYGSWQMPVHEPPTQHAHRRFVLPEIAAALQVRVRREERARARAAS